MSKRDYTKNANMQGALMYCFNDDFEFQNLLSIRFKSKTTTA